MVGVFDVVAFLAFGSTKHQIGKDPIELSELSSMDVAHLLETIDSVHPKESQRQIFALEPTETLLSLMRPFVTSGTHRLLVKVNHVLIREQCPYRILSQSDVVRFLVKNSEKLGTNFLRATVSSLGLVAGSIDSKIFAVEPLFNGFQWLYLTPNPSALAVIDEYGKLMGTLSVSDVRGVPLNNIQDTLQMSVRDFLTQTNQKEQVTCVPDSTLSEVMKSLVDNQVHRVWVVDQGGKPIGVVTLTDIIRLFLSSNLISS